MPDDKEVIEEIAEQDESEESGFQEALKNLGKSPSEIIEEKKSIVKVDIEDEPPLEKDAFPDKEKSDIEARIEELAVRYQEEQNLLLNKSKGINFDDSNLPKTVILPQVQPSGKGGKLTKEDVSRYLDAIPDDLLPDNEIIIGDKIVNIREYIEMEPDAANAMIVMANIIAEKQAKQMLENFGALSKEEMTKQAQGVTKQLEALTDDLEQTKFELKLTQLKGDWLKKVTSKDWKPFLDSQKPQIQALSNSRNVDDAKALIDYFDEYVAGKKVKASDDRKKNEKERYDEIHATTLKGSVETKGANSEDQDMDDETAGFKAELQRRKERNASR